MVALGGLVADWHGGVVAAAGQRGAVAVSSDYQEGRWSGVAVADWGLSNGAADEGEGDLKYQK